MGYYRFLVNDFPYTDFFFSQCSVQRRSKQGLDRFACGLVERRCFHEGKVDIPVLLRSAVFP